MHASYTVAKSIELNEQSQPLIVELDGKSIGIYRHNGRLFAYENKCAHSGGPVCEGALMPRVEAEFKQRETREYLSDTKFDIGCPWHGILYDLETGSCLADPTLSLNSIHVWEEGDAIKVEL